MKTLIASLIATAVGAGFAIAPASAADTKAYDQAANKAQADYRTASAKCDSLTGNQRDVCREDAKLKRARAELDAADKHDKDRMNAARRNVIQAEHELAEEKCEVLKGEAQDDCEDKADDVRDKALAALGDRDMSAVGASGAAGQTATGDRDASKAAMLERCEKMTGDDKTACMVDNKGNMTTGVAAGAGATMAERTREAMSNVKEKASNAVEKTKQMASNAGDRTAKNTSDAAITSKVKASLVAEPDLSGMKIDVDTEKGVVMLSGFVESKAEADKAVRVAKGVEGVTKVKSTIKVK
ncbi:BON domain-containing protein [Massilia sp. DD77]|uniref:BON domain-containing protein n=1 Tax=Massilia sp. DD77 TaxID=3109349 RepID=UPI002FFF9470